MAKFTLNYETCKTFRSEEWSRIPALRMAMFANDKNCLFFELLDELGNLMVTGTRTSETSMAFDGEIPKDVARLLH